MDIEKLMNEPDQFFSGVTARITEQAIEFENRCIGEALSMWQIRKEDVLKRVHEADKLQAENEKLRAERVELEQMAACVYYKQGGLCRYGEEDPANVCVFGPCPHQRSAQEVLAELEQVKRALAMMWFSYINSDKEMPHSYETEALEEAERILGSWAECMPKYLRRGPKEG